LEIHTNEVLKTRQRLNAIMAGHCGQDIEVIQKDTDRDNFMGGEEAASYGLIDCVLNSREDAVSSS
jgi:ATP-dependent Clp protease protease subunit